MESDDLIKRVPPHSLEAEMACVGAMMRDLQAADVILELLKDNDFYDERNKVIFRIVSELRGASAPIDSVSVAEKLESSGFLQKIGGSKYLSKLSESVPALSSVRYYAKVVMEKALLRSLLHVSMEIADDVFQNQSNVEHVVEHAEKSIFDLTSRKHGSHYVQLKDAINKALDDIDKIASSDSSYTGVPSGYKELDSITSGLQEGDMFVLAARPSMGKTAFALNLARNVSDFKNPETGEPAGVMVFSLEMSHQELAIRMLSSESKIGMQRIRKGQLNQQKDWNSLIEAASKLTKLKIIVDDTPAISINEIRSKSRRVDNQYGIDLIVIDHLQLITASSDAKPSFNRNAEISYISRNLKALAKELNLPIIVLSQLSRAVESRTDKRPILSDLRESGAIEQDADIVAFLYRDEYYNKESQETDTAELNIQKHRNGPTGMVKLFFRKECVLFENLDQHHEQMGMSMDEYGSSEF